MIKVDIKPLSVNEAWQGKRFKTPKYKQYEHDLLFLLPKLKIKGGKLALSIIFGFSSKGSDIDNPAKLFMDILQKKYNFNDSAIYELHIKKEIVKKGMESIQFKIIEL